MRSLAFFRSKLEAVQKTQFFPEHAKKSELTENQQLPALEAQAPCSCTMAMRPHYDSQVPASLVSEPLMCDAAHQWPEAEHPCRIEDPIWYTSKCSRKGDRQLGQKSSLLIIVILLVLLITIFIFDYCGKFLTPYSEGGIKGLRHFPGFFSCPQGWREYRGKCYFFSNMEASWIFSQSNCSSFGGSLVVFDSQEEMIPPHPVWISRDLSGLAITSSVQVYIINTQNRPYNWIGLQREDVGQPWHMMNDSVFRDSFPIRGQGRCAYLNENEVSSTWCDNRRYWICRKP